MSHDPIGSQRRRAHNRQSSAELLTRKGVQFTSASANDGVHLIVTGSHPGSLIDFWPGTGKWIPRLNTPANRGREYRGVHNLLAALRAGRF